MRSPVPAVVRAACALLLLAVPVASRASTEQVAVVRTPLGEIAWRFLPKDAPGHVKYVKHLIETGFYDGTTFHRVIPHFVIQGGDPNSKNADRSDDGEGEADRRLKAEFSTRLHYRPGTVGMARDADPDSGSCQFFIALENLPRLDGKYTIFGEVVEGLEVARRIASLPRDLEDNPLVPVPMTVRLEKRELGKGVASLETGLTGSGEVLTGPDKPRFLDPGDRLWTAPVLERAPMTPDADLAHARVDVAIGKDGRVIDVRFPRLDVPRPIMLQAIARTWTFRPALYDGRPEKVRFEIDADGGNLGAPTGGGAPIDPDAAPGGGAPGDAAPARVSAPRPVVRVPLAEGAAAPPKPARLRLTIDASGAVTAASVQESCGDADLDRRAVAAARTLQFTPATRPGRDGKKPRAVAVYLNVEARFGP